MKSNDNGSFFLPYQKRWIEDGSRLKLMEKSRQVGLSWAAAYRCVRQCAEGADCAEVWVSSRDEKQAKLVIEDCRRFAHVLGVASAGLGHELGDGGSAYCLELSGGRRVHSLSSNVDAQAGKRGGRVLDEFALHGDSRRLYAVAYPGITWGGSLELISTHRGKANFFNELVEEVREGNPKGFSHHRVTLEDALAQGFLQKLKAKLPVEDERQAMDEGAYFDFVRRSCPDEASFQQEYMCVPEDDGSAFLSQELITACESVEAGRGVDAGAKANRGRQFFLGVDIGRDRDLTVFWLLEALCDVWVTRSVRCLERVPFAEQEAVLGDYMELCGLRRVCIDQTGLGRQFAERAGRRYGATRVEGVVFTAGVKEDLAYPLRGAFEGRRLRIPASNAVRADLRCVKTEAAPGGGLRFVSERLGSSHADRFWALALAYRAARSGAGNFHYAAVGGRCKR